MMSAARCAVRLVVLLGLLVVRLPAAAAEEREPSPVEQITAALQARYDEWREVRATQFGRPDAPAHNANAVHSAVLDLAGEAVEALVDEAVGGQRDLRCLTRVAENPVLAAHLAAIAHRNPAPLFLREYLHTWCRTRPASPYNRGKLPFVQAQVGTVEGHLVTRSDLLWLQQDWGTTGDANGRVDGGEWFELKVGLVNRSPGTSVLSASVRLVPAAGETGIAVLTPALPLPELSPGEQTTLGPFRVALAPDGPVPETVRLEVAVEASDQPPSRSEVTFAPTPAPRLELSALTIDDDAMGQSAGNGNHKVEPGERVELRTELTLEGIPRLAKVGVDADEYSTFLDLDRRRLGLTELQAGKAVPVAGDFEFTVPSVEAMARVPVDRMDRRFFYDRRTTLWLAAAGCAGKVELPADWEQRPGARIACPYSAPAYHFVLPVEVAIEFGQVLVITTQPPGASIRINGVDVGTTRKGAPLLFTQVHPVRNTIVYYDVTATMEGYVTASHKLPVIWKDRTAGNLTTDVRLELTAAGPTAGDSLPGTPEEPVFVPATRPPEPPPAATTMRPQPLTVFAGAVYRRLYAGFDPAVPDADWLDRTPDAGGFEVGAAYAFTRHFRLRAVAHVLFAGGDPTARFYAPAAGDTTGSPETVIAWADSLTAVGLTLQPDFRLQVWRLLLDLGVGLHLEGIVGEVVQRSFAAGANGATRRATVQPEPLSAAARLDAGLAVDTGSRFEPYVRAFLLVPPEDGVDWGLSAGLGLRL